MDDMEKFVTIGEYHVVLYALILLFVPECLIWFFTRQGSHTRSSKHWDNGTVWLIVFCWCCSIMAGAGFRSQSVPDYIRGILFPHFTYYIGIFLIVTGIFIRGTAVFVLKKAFTLSVQTTSNQHLIQTGLYRYVRNPAYTGSVCSLLGVAFAYRHVLGVFSVMVLSLFCCSVRIYVEEKALRAQFQSEFEKYCVRTKYRLFPGIF